MWIQGCIPTLYFLYILTANKNWLLIISKENCVCMGHNNKACEWDPIKNELILNYMSIFSTLTLWTI